MILYCLIPLYKYNRYVKTNTFCYPEINNDVLLRIKDII